MISTCRRAHDQYLSPSQPFMEYNPSLFLTLSLHVHFQSNIFIISHLIFLYLMCSCPYSYNRMATAVTYFYYRSLTYHEYILPETNKFNWTTEKRGFDEMFRLLVLCVCFVDRCLSLCPCSFGPLCCLSFFDLRILITPLVSSNSSCSKCKLFFFIFADNVHSAFISKQIQKHLQKLTEKNTNTVSIVFISTY